MALAISCIVSAKISSVFGLQAAFLPFQCGLVREAGKMVLSLTNDDGSGDLEQRIFTYDD